MQPDIFSKDKKSAGRRSESGSALVYILIAIALLAALTVSFMEPSSQQTSSQSSFRSATALKGQVDTIRSAIQECVLRYPNGDQEVDNSGTGTDPGARKEYPLKPNSTYLDSPDGDRLVRNIRCPGNNTGTANDHVDIFSGSSGKFLPPPPDLFGEWQYYNGQDGVFFWIATDKSDAYLQTTLEKLDESYGACEADIVDATSGDVDMESDAGTTDGVSCPSGSTCFRVWMIVNSGALHADSADGCGV